MAYLDVREVAEAASYATVAVEPVGFTRREWQVIVLAQRDGLSSLREPDRMARLMARCSGPVQTRGLPSPVSRRCAVSPSMPGRTVSRCRCRRSRR